MFLHVLFILHLLCYNLSSHRSLHTNLHKRAGGSHGFANDQPPLSLADRLVQEQLCMHLSKCICSHTYRSALSESAIGTNKISSYITHFLCYTYLLHTIFWWVIIHNCNDYNLFIVFQNNKKLAKFFWSSPSLAFKSSTVYEQLIHVLITL